ncbi:glycosyltransferase [Butyrivibrio fibrisolvens]|uniref:glycosyltransferase n=1 Tax=Butyrivibrio fibrisolvens TaxID=831 RepID=UPI0003B77402|nr:glycosyltransferase [Butyrivibrio fibrisolvens]
MRWFYYGVKGEKFPVVIVESMAVGVPFISTDVGVVRYFPGGFIVNSVDEMAGAIGNIMNDDNLYHNKSVDGRTYARQRMQIADKVDALEAIWKA